MKIKTSITHIRDGREIVRGKTLEFLIKKQSFVSAIFLVLVGRSPKKHEEAMLNALLTSVIDHGPAVTSALSARLSVSAGNPIQASLAAGILGFGERHGMAVEAAMEFFYENANVEDPKIKINDLKNKKVRIPGFGHKIFTDRDPRAVALFAIAKKYKIFGMHCKYALVVSKEFSRISSKPLPLNIDGAIGAILCDMKIDPRLGNSIFLIGRIPGLLAQIGEERIHDFGIRRLEESEIEYI